MNFSKTLLLGLKADEFRHPLDLQATNTLKQLPGLDLIIRGLLGGVGEQFFLINNIASSILINQQQLPHLHNLLLEACQTLDLEPPQLYLKQNPIPNAYTFAMRGKQPFMVIHTSLIEILNEREIQAVMAHELGHLKCEHGVYLTLANLIVLGANLLPILGNLLTKSLQEKILEWGRCAELSCDRAALLAAQDPKVVMSVLMKLTGGSPSIASQLNLEAFIEQARTYDQIGQNDLGKMLKVSQTQQLTHPVPILRAREIDLWASSIQYEKLIKNRKMVYNDQSEINGGGWRNW